MSKKKDPINEQNKDQIRGNVEKLKDEISSIREEVDINPEEYFPDDSDLPKVDLDVKIFDYEGEIEKIKEECEETLNCLSSLYLNEEVVKKKNIYNIIQNDAQSLSDLKFSLSMSKRALIDLMRQIDGGVNHPEMYEAVGTFQKEIRDTTKMLYDIQKRMKEFYKELKDEQKNLNVGGDDVKDGNYDVEDQDISPTDTKKINEIIEQHKNDPTFLDQLEKERLKKDEDENNKKNKKN